MDWYMLRILRGQPWRLTLTLIGLTLCILLMLFLISVYQGVEYGSVEYIRQNEADLWVLQQSAWNILRGSSLLSTGHGRLISEIHGIQSVSPVLLLLSGIGLPEGKATVFLTGYDPGQPLGGPPEIKRGRVIERDADIVLDEAFARKYHFDLGQEIEIEGRKFTIAGISGGTNALVIQYAFVTLKAARELIGFPSIVTCFAIKIYPGENMERTRAAIMDEVPGVSVYNQEEFMRNNIREMETGFLPFLYTIASMGMIVLLVILSLLLSISILEKTGDFAVLKILGASQGYLISMIIVQAVFLATTSMAIAIIGFLPMSQIVKGLIPEISMRLQLMQVGWILLVVIVISMTSALLSARRLRHIYPMEVFR